ncbi:SagB/ThcOx family dehydrogenase [Gorillibacterium massiliense]|uniref:SagB/ThcOx family dehydrogenase n=1 Tax=Gorillibacterium massiliense TaxID=1280390 RepID=UPI0004B84BF7|nr:SagB/ThcOx family dehydrogenase [Gorillibacterium massiliense]
MLEEQLNLKAIIHSNRHFMKSDFGELDFESDQDKGLTQPPLTKKATAQGSIQLPTEYADVLKEANYFALLEARKSQRVYKQESLTLEQLAFLLWSTQGIKSTRGNQYATVRPVPSAGARHPFETYLAVFRVEGLAPGIYHYLPFEHALEFLHEVDDLEDEVSRSLCDQKWAAKGAVTFFYSAVPYRSEWRYSILSHRVMLMDAGHVMQNLYLSSVAIGCGTCAIAAFDQKVVDGLLGLDGEEEFVVYAAPVGVV